MNKRRHIPIRWVRKLLKEQGGWCAAPGCRTAIEIYQGRRNFIVEHIIPRALCPAGKKDQLKNLELRCVPCAKHKTNGFEAKATARGTDNYEIKKAARNRRKAKPRTKKHRWQHRPLRSAGFQKGPRPMRRFP